MLLRVRSGWHLVVGALIPWLPVEGAIPLALLFLTYEYLQYRHNHTWNMRDDSYLDVLETAVALGISGVVRLIFQILG